MSIYHIKPTFDLILTPQTHKLQNLSLELKPNQTIKAEVVDQLPSGRIIVNINGIYVNMRTEIPLQKDTLLYLKVLEPKNGEKDLQLRLLSFEPPKRDLSFLDQIKDLKLFFMIKDSDKEQIWKSVSKKNLNLPVAKLRQIVDQPVVKKLNSNLNAEALRDFIQKSGLFFEKRLYKLTDLIAQKTDLSRFRQLFESIKADLRIDSGQLQSLLKLFQSLKDQNPQIDQLFKEPSIDHFLSLLQEAKKINIDPKVLIQLLRDNQGWESLASQLQMNDLSSFKNLYEKIAKLTISSNNLNRFFNQIENPLQLQQLLLAHKHPHFSELTTLFGRLNTKEQSIEKLEEEIRKLKRELKEDLKNYLPPQHVHHFQLLSSLLGGIYTYLPLFWDDLQDGSLLIQKRAESFFVQIDLDFKDLGRVGAHILLAHDDIKVVFFASDGDFLKFLAKDFDTLEAKLSAHFRYTFISIGEPRESESFLKDHLVDKKV